MIHCEEKLLKSIIASIKKYASEHIVEQSFYNNIADLQSLSLQKISIKSDLEYFEEINKLLSVIATIIAHPHIVNAQQRIIIRAEQAHGLTPHMFHDTVLNSKLWKDKKGIMTPAEVYYFQNIDDLKNYENRFVVHLVNIVSAQLAEYVKFYDFLVGTLIQGSILTQDNSALDRAYQRLLTLARKVKLIKTTYFYREVCKANTHFTHVGLTNVLIHNRAYNACYKFYLNNVTYGDEEMRASDITIYYFTRILLALSACGFELDSQKTQHVPTFYPKNMQFTSKDFNVNLEGAPEFGGMFVTVQPKTNKNLATKNLIVFVSDVGFEEVKKSLAKYKKSGAYAVDAVTFWDAAYVDDSVRSLNMGGMSENAIILKYIQDKTRLIKASKQIYRMHCPACGSRDVHAVDNNTYSCPTCGTNYAFIDKNIWFTKLRIM